MILQLDVRYPYYNRKKSAERMGCLLTKVKLSKQDELFLLENTQFNKQQIAIWFSGFKKDCPSGKNFK